jgi:AcrR family transcriptional regulator
MSTAQQDLHLWKLPRGRHGLSPELVARSQRERLIAAVVGVAAAKGYQATSVADILKVAGVGRESFYRYFENKEDCFLAANDVLIGHLETEIEAAYELAGPWPTRVRVALAAALRWLAADPDVSRVMLIEMGTVGPVATERFRRNFHRLSELLDEGKKLSGEAAVELPSITRIAGAAVFARVYEEVAMGDARALPALAPELTFELLVPFLGEVAAARERVAAEREVASA